MMYADSILRIRDDVIKADYIEVTGMDMSELIRKIELILIETGQHDKEKFKLGETIKYAPYEVAEILREHIVELQAGMR